MLAKRKIKLNELSKEAGITISNLSCSLLSPSAGAGLEPQADHQNIVDPGH